MTNVKRLVVEEPPLSMDYQMNETASSCSSVRSRILRPRLASPPSHAPCRRYSPNIFRANNTAATRMEEETLAPMGVLDTVKGVLRKFLPEKWLNNSESDDHGGEGVTSSTSPASKAMNDEEVAETMPVDFKPVAGRSKSPLSFSPPSQEKECVEDIYRRILKPGRDRVSLYRDLAKFFRAKGNCLLSREQFEELSLLIQRQAPVTPMRLEALVEPSGMGEHTAGSKRERTLSAQVETSNSINNTLPITPVARPPVLKPVAVAGAPPGTPSARRSAATCRRIRRARVFSARFEDAEMEMLEQMEWQREVEEQQKVSQLLGTVTARQRLAEETRRRMAEQIRLANTPAPPEIKEPVVTLPSSQPDVTKLPAAPQQQQPTTFEFKIPQIAPSTIGTLAVPSEIPKLTFDLDAVPAKEDSKPSTSLTFRVPEEKVNVEAPKIDEPKEMKSPIVQPASSLFNFSAPASTGLPNEEVKEKKEVSALPLQSTFSFGLKPEPEKPKEAEIKKKEEEKPPSLPAFPFTPSFGLSRPLESKEEVKQPEPPTLVPETGPSTSTPFSFSAKPIPNTTGFGGGFGMGTSSFGTFGTTPFGSTSFGTVQSSEKKTDVEGEPSSKKTNFSGIFGETKPLPAPEPTPAPAPFSSIGSTQSIDATITEPKAATSFGAFTTPSSGEKAPTFTFGPTTETTQPVSTSSPTLFGFGATSSIPLPSTAAPSFGSSGFSFGSGSNQAPQPPSTGFSFGGGGLSGPGISSTTTPTVAPTTAAPPATTFSFGGAAQQISSSGGALFSAPSAMDASSAGTMMPGAGADTGDARRFSKPISRRRR